MKDGRWENGRVLGWNDDFCSKLYPIYTSSTPSLLPPNLWEKLISMCPSVVTILTCIRKGESLTKN